MTYHIRCRGEYPNWLVNAYDDFIRENGVGVAIGTNYSAWELFEKANKIKLIRRGFNSDPHMVEFKDQKEATMFLLRWS